MIFGGIDAGSRSVKAVLLDDSLAILASSIRDQGPDQQRIADDILNELLREAGLTRDRVARVIATGYGRGRAAVADGTITEITCQAAGVRHLAPDAATIIDIGGQDSKVVRLDEDGRVRDFAMNDRCAAGSGRFLEMAAARLDIPLCELPAGEARPAVAAAINSTCAVFAETEIVGLLASGEPAANIMAGIRKAIAARVASMAGALIRNPIVFTGGVARVGGMSDALAEAIGHPVTVAPRPQLTGAIGAAILAASEYRDGTVKGVAAGRR